MPNVIFDITVMEPSTTIDETKEIKHDDKETHERTDNRKDNMKRTSFFTRRK